MIVIKTPTKKKFDKLNKFLGDRGLTSGYIQNETDYVMITNNEAAWFMDKYYYKRNHSHIKPISVKKYIKCQNPKPTTIKICSERCQEMQEMIDKAQKEFGASAERQPTVIKVVSFKKYIKAMKKNGDMLIEKYKNKQLRMASAECEEKVKLLQQRIRTLEILLSVEIEHLKNRNLWDRIFNV